MAEQSSPESAWRPPFPSTIAISHVCGKVAAGANGVFDLVLSTTDGEPPVYRKQGCDGHKWLFLSKTNKWWVGETEDKDLKDDKGRFHSAVVRPGVLPHHAECGSWELRYFQKWDPEPTARVCALSAAQSQATARRLEAIWNAALRRGPAAIKISGITVESAAETVNGIYVLTERHAGKPPIYLNQDNKDMWLFLASNNAWYVGNIEGKSKRSNSGFLFSNAINLPRHSDMHPIYSLLMAMNRTDHLCGHEQAISPLIFRFLETAVLPHEEECNWWEVYDSNKWVPQPGVLLRGLTVAEVETAKQSMRLLWDKATARSPHRIRIEYASGGSAILINGTYRLAETAHGQPPVYKHEAVLNMWLYLANGMWLVSNTDGKVSRKPAGWLSSKLVSAGVLPHEVTESANRWQEYSADSWVDRPLLSVRAVVDA